jgi:hypothetical protein
LPFPISYVARQAFILAFDRCKGKDAKGYHVGSKIPHMVVELGIFFICEDF